MNRLLLLGAGKIGGTIARMLASSGHYHLRIADRDAALLGGLSGLPNIECRPGLDVLDHAALHNAMLGVDAVISALSFHHNIQVAEAAAAAGLSYFDLTEDIATRRAIRRIAQRANADTVFMPQCGLAPGFVSILANDLAGRFDKADHVAMRVGALPQFPTNALKYNLTWSTDGLINEYCNTCEAIVDGRLIEAQPLEALEEFSLDGMGYEAFNTSGGLGTLCETWAGRVTDMDYKTVRYRGHRDLARFLVRDMALGRQRELFKEILEHAVPMTYQDVVVVFCTASGWRDGRLVQVSDARKLYPQTIAGEPCSAIQVTTAAGMCAVVDLFFAGELGAMGFVRQEQVPLEAFLANRFGTHYDTAADARFSVSRGDAQEAIRHA